MKRVLIFLILTLACAFGSYTSFMSNDYGPLKHWMAYYKEYKEIQGALDKGNASKAELLAKLKAMYPEKADQIEAQFKAKYGSLKDSAEDCRRHGQIEVGFLYPRRQHQPQPLPIPEPQQPVVVFPEQPEPEQPQQQSEQQPCWRPGPYGRRPRQQPGPLKVFY